MTLKNVGNPRHFVQLICCFATVHREWYNVPDLLVDRIVPGVATLNGKIYVVGGEQVSNTLACCECYDPEENSWSMVASMIVPKCEFGLCALNGYLYALGGWIGDDIGGYVERYDPKVDEWKHVGMMPEPRFSMGVVAYESECIFIGSNKNVTVSFYPTRSFVIFNMSFLCLVLLYFITISYQLVFGILQSLT